MYVLNISRILPVDILVFIADIPTHQIQYFLSKPAVVSIAQTFLLGVVINTSAL
jgi:hypothetical protein